MVASRPVALVVAVMLVGLGALATRAQAKDVTFVTEAKFFEFSLNLLDVDPGDNVTIVVFNNETSAIPHTFDLDEYNIHLGTRSDPILPGQNRTANFTASSAGTFYFYCNVLGHATDQGGGRWGGMAGILQVGDAPPPADPTPIIVGGLVVLAVSLAAIVYVIRRDARKPKSP